MAMGWQTNLQRKKQPRHNTTTPSHLQKRRLSNRSFSPRVYGAKAGVTMTLFCTHGRVSGPNSQLDHEVIAPYGYSVPCQF